MAGELQVKTELNASRELFFDYDLPERLIAQSPAPQRDRARLLVVRREAVRLEHHHVHDLPSLLSPGDLLVFNDSRVLPARLVGTRVKTGGKWEALFLRDADGLWECLAQTRGYAMPDETFRTHTGLTLKLRARTADRHWLLEPLAHGAAFELLDRFGEMPLPPYIRRGVPQAEDRERYQTVYARAPGSVAAPTAGLHFTPELLHALAVAGIPSTHVTLHVGLGTFAPVKSADPRRHVIHREWCEVTPGTVAQIHAAAGRVIAVGTTTVRTLETAAACGRLEPYRGESSLFIHPPYTFNAVNALLTNFHLPRTTLLLLVQAFCGADLLRAAYQEAIDKEYRFYSYGDAMLIL